MPPFRSMEELMDGELSYVVAVPNTPEAALTVQVLFFFFFSVTARPRLIKGGAEAILLSFIVVRVRVDRDERHAYMLFLLFSLLCVGADSQTASSG